MCDSRIFGSTGPARLYHPGFPLSLSLFRPLRLCFSERCDARPEQAIQRYEKEKKQKKTRKEEGKKKEDQRQMIKFSFNSFSVHQ